MNLENYVMIGHSHILGDLIEIIHANHDILTKIVQNIPESAYRNRPLLKQRLERLQNPQYNPHNVNQFYPVLIQSLDDFQPQQEEKYIIGFTGFKMLNLVRHLTKTFKLQFAPLIHPSAIIAPDVVVSSGVIIQAGAIIASGVRIKEHTFINKGVKIGWQAKIESFVSIAPGATIGQNTWIKTGATLGIGSVTLDDIIVNDHSIVAAGATVVRDVPINTLVAGVPAIIKKTHLYPNINDDSITNDQKTV